MSNFWDSIKAAWIAVWAKNSVKPSPLPPPQIWAAPKRTDGARFVDHFAERNNTPEGIELNRKILQCVSNIRAGIDPRDAE